MDWQAAEPEDREGLDEPPQPTDDETMALTVFNILKNGSGGLDFAGLPLVAEWLGVQDVAGLLQRLVVIKSYRKPAERGDSVAAQE
jgi:hypothetical protein